MVLSKKVILVALIILLVLGNGLCYSINHRLLQLPTNGVVLFLLFYWYQKNK